MDPSASWEVSRVRQGDRLRVTAEIRGPAVTTAVSPVSAMPEVRHLLVAQQRRIMIERGLATVVRGRQ